MSDILSVPELKEQFQEQGVIHVLDPTKIAVIFECPVCGEAEWCHLNELDMLPMCCGEKCVLKLVLQKIGA